MRLVGLLNSHWQSVENSIQVFVSGESFQCYFSYAMSANPPFGGFPMECQGMCILEVTTITGICKCKNILVTQLKCLDNFIIRETPDSNLSVSVRPTAFINVTYNN